MKNKNRIITALLALLLGFTFAALAAPAVAADAAGGLARIVDWADLLSDSEEAALSEQLDEISERQRVDIVVVTTDSLAGMSVVEYADDFYDDNGYGFGTGKDGILLLVSMEERDWYISTSGYGVTAVTDAGRMSETFVPYLSEGEYAKAFHLYAELCDEYITMARAGGTPTEPFSHVRALIIAIAAGFVTALIATGMMRHSLRSVRSQPAAASYVKRDSLRLTKEYEQFLYRNVTRTEKPKENSSSNSRSGGSATHTSSSGRKHGGGGGKF